MKAKTMVGRASEAKASAVPALVTPYIKQFLIQHDFPEKYTLNPAAYMEEVEGFPHKWNDRFHPSSDIAPSELDLYNAKHPVIGPTLKRESFTPSSMIAMQVGTAMHAMFEAVLVQIGLTTKDECEIFFKEETLGISGLCDIRKVHIPEGDVLVDIKTCSKLPTKPSLLHELQVMLYMDLMKDAPKELGTVLYLEKAYPHSIIDIPVKFDRAALEGLYAKWIRVRAAIKNNDPSGLSTK